MKTVFKPYRVRIYAPKGMVPKEKLEALAMAAGGLTATNGGGMWVTPHGGLVSEPITILEVVHERRQLQDVGAAITDIMLHLKEQGEHSVFVEDSVRGARIVEL